MNLFGIDFSIGSFISNMISALSLVKDSFQAVFVSISQNEFFPVYFFPPLSDERGNTSSAFIPFLVENNTSRPVSIISAMIKDKYNKKYWHYAVNWECDYSISVAHFDGFYKESTKDSSRFPIIIPAYESRVIKILFPFSGNNLMRDDFTTDFNGKTGAPWSVDFTVKLFFSKRFLFFRKTRIVKGSAFVGKTISSNDMIDFPNSNSN